MSPETILVLVRTVLGDLWPLLETLAKDSKTSVDDTALAVLGVLLGIDRGAASE